jgi:RNA polymerase sigma-70 factor (ECF subfamily)
VDAAIRALSPALREVIVLREFEDLEYAEIAKIVGVPVGTVMSRLSRARDKLRSVLSPSNLGL